MSSYNISEFPPGGKAFLQHLDSQLESTVYHFQQQMHALGMSDRIDNDEIKNLRREYDDLSAEQKEWIEERKRLMEDKERLEKRLILMSTENHRLRIKLQKVEEEEEEESLLSTKYKRALIYIDQLQSILRRRNFDSN